MTPREWIKTRGITAATVAAFGIRFSGDEIKFPYVRGGKEIGAKYRRYPEAEGRPKWRSTTGEAAPLFNQEAATGEDLFLTEGEFDALALHSSGIPQDRILSLPNGAQSLAALKRAHEDGLRFKSLTILHDADDAGFSCREQIVELVGPALCKFVEWPEGVKDANDFLLAEGPSDLKAFVEAARPWPLPGLCKLSDLPEPPPLEVWELGFADCPPSIKTGRGLLSVFTGHPGHGKSHLSVQIWTQIAQLYQFGFAILSMETRPKPYVRRRIRQVLTGKLEAHCTPKEIAQADAWIEEYFWWLTPKRAPDLDWMLDHAEAAVVRHGVRSVLIDPWNKLENQRPKDMPETEFIGRCLDRCMEFAQAYNCHVQIIAHPAKVMNKTKATCPDLMDISGSKNWDNRVDQGWAVHRPTFTDDAGRQVTDCDFIQLKSRYEEEIGFNGAVIPFRMNKDRGVYECIEAETYLNREINK